MKKVIKSIMPLNEKELEKDILFTFQTRSDTDEQFVQEMKEVVKSHVNQALVNYQVQLIDDLSRSLHNSVVDIVVRSKFETIVEEDHEW